MITTLFENARPFTRHGSVASYIPALQKESPHQLALTLCDAHGNYISLGDDTKKFSMQSVSKVINFLLALHYNGTERVLKYVDLEPSGNAFNSIARLEDFNEGKPDNPFINAGAIAIVSLLPGATATEKVNAVLQFLQPIVTEKLSIDNEIAQSEQDTSDHNRAIAYYLKSKNYLVGDINIVLEAYFKLCSITITTRGLAEIGMFLAAEKTHATLCIAPEIFSLVKSTMLTCGMYNRSGKFVARVGFPAKSGVSGAILACLKHGQIENLHGAIGIGVFSPSIDNIGNSIAGVTLLKSLSKEYKLHQL